MFGLFIIAALAVGFVGSANKVCEPGDLNAKKCAEFVKDNSTAGGPYNE